MVSDKPWGNFTKADYTDEQYKKACLYCDTDCLKDSTSKQCCKLPVREPNGALNRNGVQAAYAAMRGARGGVKGLSSDDREKIMNKLRRLYREVGMDLPEALKSESPTHNKVHGIIWDRGIHKLWIKEGDAKPKPAKLKVTDRSLKRDYDLLSNNLPIPIGIDHLDDNILKENKVLDKMNLLEAGQINEIKLTDEGIEIVDAELYNDTLNDLYNNGDLTDFSIVADLYSKNTDNPDCDYIEDYSIIKRVDFVGTGGCETCKVKSDPVFLNARIHYYTDEEIIGDIMNEDKIVLDETVKEEINNLITAKISELEDKITDLCKAYNDMQDEEEEEEEEGEELVESKKGEANAPEISELQREIDEIKEEKHLLEAKNVVKEYLDAGKILPKDVEKHENLAVKELSDYKELMADAPVVINFEEESKKSDEDETDMYSDYEKHIRPHLDK